MLTYLPIRKLSTSTFYHKMMIVTLILVMESESNLRR